MQIRTQILRDFFKRTNFIGPHHIIPICSCIRIYAGQIIRTNTAETAVFTSEEIPADADVVLDIAKLQAICATTNAEFLTITQDGTTTIVKETRARNTFGYENPQAYPAVPDTSDAAYCALSSEDISAITMTLPNTPGTAPRHKYNTFCRSKGYVEIRVNGVLINGHHYQNLRERDRLMRVWRQRYSNKGNEVVMNVSYYR